MALLYRETTPAGVTEWWRAWSGERMRERLLTLQPEHRFVRYMDTRTCGGHGAVGSDVV